MLYWEMMKLLVPLLVFSGVTCSEGDPPCSNFTDRKELGVIEGEALLILPHALKDINSSHLTWHRGDTSISSSEEERIHHHGPVLLFLPLSINDSGLYIALYKSSENCAKVHVPVKVSASVPMGMGPLYIPIKVSDSNPNIPCPEQVTDVCTYMKGGISWYRNSSLIAGEKSHRLQLERVTEEHNGAMYTCICTWLHAKKEYKSTASRKLLLEEKKAYHDIQIIPPSDKDRIVHLGGLLNPGSPVTQDGLFG